MSEHHSDNDMRRLVQEAYKEVEPSRRVYCALRARLFATARQQRAPLSRYEASRLVPLAAMMLLASLFLFFAPRQHIPLAPHTDSSPAPVALSLTPDRETESAPLGAWSEFRFVAELR